VKIVLELVKRRFSGYKIMKIRGVVIRGKNKGEKIGFPTINLQIEKDCKDSLESGTYAGKVFLEGDHKKAAIFIGLDKNILEAHILDFAGNLRGEIIEVEIGEKIRDVEKFDTDEDLTEQISKDVEKIKNID
jgi:riboflavin kinase/FMN adenylyltransferase